MGVAILETEWLEDGKPCRRVQWFSDLMQAIHRADELALIDPELLYTVRDKNGSKVYGR